MVSVAIWRSWVERISEQHDTEVLLQKEHGKFLGGDTREEGAYQGVIRAYESAHQGRHYTRPGVYPDGTVGRAEAEEAGTLGETDRPARRRGPMPTGFHALELAIVSTKFASGTCALTPLTVKDKE